MLRLVIIPFLVLFFFNGFGQKCFEYHKEHCKPEKTKFTYQVNNQSISFSFMPGEVHEIPIQLYEGKDYKLTICADEIFSDVIQFKIHNTETEKLIYDNSTNNFALNLEFTNKKTQQTIFTIQAPEVSDANTEIEGCIGILIEEMLSVKTGF